MNKKRRNVIGAVIIIVVLGALIAYAIRSSYRYYYTVDEVRERMSTLVGKDVKMAGEVVKGSIEHKSSGAGVLFVMGGAKEKIKVDYSGQVPDTFQDGMPVVVEGKISGQGFIAFSLLTKCASRYEEKLD